MIEGRSRQGSQAVSSADMSVEKSSVEVQGRDASPSGRQRGRSVAERDPAAIFVPTSDDLERASLGV
ncbi:hypothetical protein BDY24DRAFT_389172 [Mrakia frigida]|uniref:uncharacterized protein n=1 Tax=Mrakia frigida TaxID=29902 RepID=UPI003FCC0FBC